MGKLIQELAILISSLNIEKFRLLIQGYLRERYNTSDVFITDGPYDGGNDLEIRINERTIKRNVQITVQKKGLEDKLEEDLEKSKNNVDKFSYLDKLDFYYNQKLTKSKIDELKLNAELKYGIDLNIFDANIIAQLNDTYSSIKTNTFNFLNINSEEELVKVDKQSKILFDLLAIGNEAGEVKKQFIYSFIFAFLFEKPNSTIDEIMAFVSLKLPDVIDLKFYRDSLSSLKGKNILITDESKKLFSLSEEKSNEIKNIYEKAIMQESVLKEMLLEILKKNGLESQVSVVAEFLYNLYKENYKIDIDEITQNSFSVNSSIKKIYQELERFFTSQELTIAQAKDLTNEIIDGCSKNEYLNKIGASILFANLYKSNKLDDYLNQRNQDCYLDTQVLLRLICYQYNPSDYDDAAFKSVKSLYEAAKEFESNVFLNTSYDYLTEVSGHIQEALKLQRFLSLPIFEKFRTSKNIFFNYFTHLQQSDEIDKEMTLEEFIDDLLGIETPKFNDPDFEYIVGMRLKALFEVMNINVIYHPTYEHFSVLRKEYEMTLSFLDKRRSYHARDNDLRMI